MKKILSVILGCTLIFSLVGCSSMVSKNKEVLTADSFKAHFEGVEDYAVVDFTYQCEGMPIKTALAADDKVDGYGIEFYIYEDEASAQKMYDENVEIFSQFAKEPVITEGENYQKFEGSGGLSFWSLTRVDNTILLCDTVKDHQPEVSAVVAALGY